MFISCSTAEEFTSSIHQISCWWIDLPSRYKHQSLLSSTADGQVLSLRIIVLQDLDRYQICHDSWFQLKNTAQFTNSNMYNQLNQDQRAPAYENFVTHTARARVPERLVIFLSPSRERILCWTPNWCAWPSAVLHTAISDNRKRNWVSQALTSFTLCNLQARSMHSFIVPQNWTGHS